MEFRKERGVVRRCILLEIGRDIGLVPIAHELVFVPITHFVLESMYGLSGLTDLGYALELVLEWQKILAGFPIRKPHPLRWNKDERKNPTKLQRYVIIE